MKRHCQISDSKISVNTAKKFRSSDDSEPEVKLVHVHGSLNSSSDNDGMNSFAENMNAVGKVADNSDISSAISSIGQSSYILHSYEV